MCSTTSRARSHPEKTPTNQAAKTETQASAATLADDLQDQAPALRRWVHIPTPPIRQPFRASEPDPLSPANIQSPEAEACLERAWRVQKPSSCRSGNCPTECLSAAWPLPCLKR